MRTATVMNQVFTKGDRRESAWFDVQFSKLLVQQHRTVTGTKRMKLLMKPAMLEKTEHVHECAAVRNNAVSSCSVLRVGACSHSHDWGIALHAHR